MARLPAGVIWIAKSGTVSAPTPKRARLEDRPLSSLRSKVGARCQSPFEPFRKRLRLEYGPEVRQLNNLPCRAGFSK